MKKKFDLKNNVLFCCKSNWMTVKWMRVFIWIWDESLLPSFALPSFTAMAVMWMMIMLNMLEFVANSLQSPLFYKLSLCCCLLCFNQSQIWGVWWKRLQTSFKDPTSFLVPLIYPCSTYISSLFLVPLRLLKRALYG